MHTALMTSPRFLVPQGERLFVIAGTYAEATWWRREHGLAGHQVKIVQDARDLIGHRNITVAMVGNYTDRADLHEIVRYLGAVGFNRVA